MSELKIDEKNIRGLTRKATELMKEMMADVECLENKDADVFERYMCLHRLGCMVVGATQAHHMAMHSLRFGFDLQHPFFQTKEAVERGWDKTELEKNPFFVQEDDDKPRGMAIEIKDLPDEIKEALVRMIKKSIEEKKNHAH